MALALTINSVSRSWQHGSLRIEAVRNSRQTITFDVRSMDASWRPALDQAVVFTEGGTAIFGGTILSLEEQSSHGQVGNTTPIKTTVTAVDYNALPDRRFISTSLPSGLSLKAALTILVAYLATYGTTLHASQATGPTLEALTFDYVQLTDVLNQLASLTGYIWQIDASNVLRMSLPTSLAAPFNVSLSGKQANGDVIVRQSRDKYANRVILLAGGVTTRAVAKDGQGNKYYGPGTTTTDGQHRYWSLSPAIVSWTYGDVHRLGLNVVVGGMITEWPVWIFEGNPTTEYTVQGAYNVLEYSPTDYWTLDETSGTTADDIGSGNHDLTWSGSPIIGVLLSNGRRGVLMDGVDDSGAIASVAASTTTFTFSAWVRPDFTQGTTRGLFFEQGSNLSAVYIDKTLKTFGFCVTGSTFKPANSNILQDGVLAHIALVVTAGAGQFYVNGVACGTATSIPTFTPSLIGTATGSIYKGAIADVLYKAGTAMTGAQIADITSGLDGSFLPRLHQYIGEAALDPADYLTLEYTGQYPIKVIAEDTGEQASNGLREVVITTDAITHDLAQAQATAYLARAILNPKTVTYPTYQAGLLPGRTQNIVLAARNLNGDYTVTEVHARDCRNNDNAVMERIVTAVEGDDLPQTWEDTYKEWRAASSGGATGAAGTPGEQGDPGTPGAPGTPGTVWYDGSGAPSDGTGIDGDYYLDTSNGDVYRKVSGSWSPVGNI